MKKENRIKDSLDKQKFDKKLMHIYRAEAREIINDQVKFVLDGLMKKKNKYKTWMIIGIVLNIVQILIILYILY